jgi:hypothetical protein
VALLVMVCVVVLDQPPDFGALPVGERLVVSHHPDDMPANAVLTGRA